MQHDPAKGSCSAGTPQSPNRYSYVLNDSINRADLLGLTWKLVGCSTYPDGVGRYCTVCSMQDDENDVSRNVVFCDRYPVQVFNDPQREPPFLIDGERVIDKPASVDEGCGPCCVGVWDRCFAVFKANVKAVGGSKGAITDCIGLRP